jgi:hypothetical protein
VAAPDELALADELRDFDSLVFSLARPALDETVSLPLRRPERAPLLPQGALADAPVPRLLALLHAGQATGALSVGRGPVKKLLLLEGGAPVLATSNVAAERFGARCVQAGILDAEALSALVAGLEPGESTAAALLARGLLDPALRARMVAEQVLEILWSTFDWRDGTYRVVLQPLPVRERVRLDLFPGEIVLEGMRRTAGLALLRAELPADAALAPAQDPCVELHRLGLRSREAEMLAHADGTKSVRDLVALSGLGERAALAFLQGCRHLGLLDEVDRVLASTRRIGFM